MTPTAFLAAYRAELIARYPWAQDVEKLDKFMASVAETIGGRRVTWNHDGEAVRAAWRATGCKNRCTLKGLRELKD